MLVRVCKFLNKMDSNRSMSAVLGNQLEPLEPLEAYHPFFQLSLQELFGERADDHLVEHAGQGAGAVLGGIPSFFRRVV